MGEVAVHVAVVVDIDRPPVEDRVDELVVGEVRSSPGPVDREEPEHRGREVPEVGVGVCHRLVGLLGRGVDRELGVGLVGLGKRHLVIRAVDRAGRGHQQVPDLVALGGLHDVEGPDHVDLDVGPGVLERVPDTGLGREVDDHVGPKLVGDRLQ